MDKQSNLEQALKLLAATSGNPDDPASPAETHPDDELVAALLDDTLDEPEAAKVRRHLAECPACYAAFTALKETEAIEGPPVPAALLAAARDLVREPLARATASVILKLVQGALELVGLGGGAVAAGPPLAADPVRSAAGSAAGRAEAFTITPSLPHVRSITFQRVDPDDVRLLVEPARPAGAATLVRLDLAREGTLMQSWPLEAGTVALEPVTLGRYTLSVIEYPLSAPADPDAAALAGTVAGSLAIELI